MKASLFAQMGYAERHKFPAIWPVPPSYHDPAVTMHSYEDGLEECVLAEEMGFDWISCSEHHYSGNRLTPNPAVMAAAAPQRGKKVRIAPFCELLQRHTPNPGVQGARRIATVQEGADRPVRATAAASQSRPGCRGDWDAGQPHWWPGDHGVPGGHPQRGSALRDEPGRRPSPAL